MNSDILKYRLHNEAFWHGLAAAMVADEDISDDEIQLLRSLLAEHTPDMYPLETLRGLLKEISNKRGATPTDRRRILGMLKSICDNLTPAEKGFLFESYVVACFDKSEYDLVEWRSDKFTGPWRPRSSKWPDILMESRKNPMDRVAIECKYRSKAVNGEVRLAYDDQLRRYRDYGQREDIAVYLALGFGGEPTAPVDFYLARVRDLRNGTMTLRGLEKYRMVGQEIIIAP